MKVITPPIFLFLAITASLVGEVHVYEYPEVIVEGDLGVNKRSDLYTVEVNQDGNWQTAYVMYDKNQEWHHRSLKANPDHHWTNFSFSGKVKVKVSKLRNGIVEACTIYPRRKAVEAKIVDGSAEFEIDEEQLPLQIWVDVDGPEKDVLLIFADPIEQNVPQTEDEHTIVVHTSDSVETVRQKLQGSAKTIIFDKGIHRWGDATDNTYAGYKLPVLDHKEIYIPGGAYIIGSFDATGPEGDWHIHGRGVISACGKERLPSAKAIPWSLIYSRHTEARGQIIDGIVSICPPHFNLTLRGECVIKNVKMFGWWHQTDGVITGNNSQVLNCFYKVMDDFIKVYRENCYFENNTMFHGHNGAPFQFAWSNQHGDNNLMKDTYIIHSHQKKAVKEINNTTLINVRKGKTDAVSENNTWDGIYIDNGCNGFLGMNGNGGIFRNFTIKNVVLNSGMKDKPQFSRSYMVDGTFENIVIKNMIVDGHRITGTHPTEDRPEEGKLWVEGDTSALVFK
ncbi:MAG: hypothetical protein MI748_07930 [Opitutales bacterium]|nr:hypothetical protein [Opitutales bacterium]